MAKWQTTLRLTDLWNSHKQKRLPLQDLAKYLAERLKSLNSPHFTKFVKDEQTALVEKFLEFYIDPAMVGSDNAEAVTAFNDLMFDLYNWADLSLDSDWNGKKVCW